MPVLFRLFLSVALLSFAIASQASHEADHRYRIFGTVHIADGTPAANTKVRLTGLGGRPLGESTTGSNGEYEFRLHVHNQDLGTHFWVSANGMTRKGMLTFNPADKMTERVHRIDLPKSE